MTLAEGWTVGDPYGPSEIFPWILYYLPRGTAGQKVPPVSFRFTLLYHPVPNPTVLQNSHAGGPPSKFTSSGPRLSGNRDRTIVGGLFVAVAAYSVTRQDVLVVAPCLVTQQQRVKHNTNKISHQQDITTTRSSILHNEVFEAPQRRCPRRFLCGFPNILYVATTSFTSSTTGICIREVPPASCSTWHRGSVFFKGLGFSLFVAT
jgi:hypothetical protein